MIVVGYMYVLPFGSLVHLRVPALMALIYYSCLRFLFFLLLSVVGAMSGAGACCSGGLAL